MAWDPFRLSSRRVATRATLLLFDCRRKSREVLGAKADQQQTDMCAITPIDADASATKKMCGVAPFFFFCHCAQLPQTTKKSKTRHDSKVHSGIRCCVRSLQVSVRNGTYIMGTTTQHIFARDFGTWFFSSLTLSLIHDFTYSLSCRVVVLYTRCVKGRENPVVEERTNNKTIDFAFFNMEGENLLPLLLFKWIS